MNVFEIIKMTRAFMDDNTRSAPLYDDEALLTFCNDAEEEAATRSPLLIDRTTASVCQIPIVAGTYTYNLSPLVLRIRKAWLSSDKLPLSKKMIQELDETLYDWRATQGIPNTYCEDHRTLTLIPVPSATDTLNLEVVRLPLIPLTLGGTPEIPAEYHKYLPYWMCHLAFLKSDADTGNLEKAMLWERKFTQVFGERPSPKKVLQDKYYNTQSTMKSRGFGY